VFDFPRDVQPILDKHCVSCHNPGKLSGGVLLTGDRGPMFSHSYFELTRMRQVADGRNQAVSNRDPYTIGAVASPLMHKVLDRHHNVGLSQNELDRIRFWIETGAPYPGTYAALGSGMIGGYAENKQVGTDFDWPEAKSVAEIVETRCMSCHQDSMNLPVALSDEIGLSFWQPSFTDPRLRYSRHRLFNLSHPELSLMLLAPLAGEAGGLGLCMHDSSAVFETINDPGYQAILALNRRGKQELDRIKRFDMPGFRPPAAYMREMQRFGVLPASHDSGAVSIDFYQTDRAYWDLFDLEKQ
jgi:hypothetical protein